MPWRLIAGTRDRLIHAYFKVGLEMVWAMVEDDLPRLRTEVRRLAPARKGPEPGAMA